MKKYKMVCLITIGDPELYSPESFREEIEMFNKANSPGMEIEVESVEEKREDNLKRYRVWIDGSPCVLIGALDETQARCIVYAGMKEGKYQGKKITRVECLS